MPPFVVGLPKKRRSKDTWEQFSNATGPDRLQVGSCPLGGLNDPLRQVAVISVVDLLRVTRTPQESSGSEVAAGLNDLRISPSILRTFVTRLHHNPRDKGLKSSISQS